MLRDKCRQYISSRCYQELNPSENAITRVHPVSTAGMGVDDDLPHTRSEPFPAASIRYQRVQFAVYSDWPLHSGVVPPLLAAIVVLTGVVSA